MKPISPFGLPIGISVTVWGIIGLLRLISEKLFVKSKKINPNFKPSDIAALVPAHNEELVIRRCIKALKQMLDPKQIYVVSDGSVDKTYRRARMEGCHVSYLTLGRGKAKALIYLISRFHLYENYKLIFIVDSDTQIDKHFVERALPMFNDPEISVVFGSARIFWPKHIIPRLKLYFIAYRERLNRMLQYLLIYGQTWKYTNVNYVIPGFATIFRSHILKKLEIDTPGLLIEDFNTAFELHRKRLGKIGYKPSLIGWDQHPDNLADYWKQVKRWNIGFFQTVKINGVWPSFFWLTLGVFSAEVILHSFFILLLPVVIIFLVLKPISHLNPLFNVYTAFYQNFGLFTNLDLGGIFVAVFLYDYILTVVIGIINKKPQFIIYGLFFFFMHYVVSLILISSLIPGFFGKSAGRWVSPKRHTIGQEKIFATSS